MISMNKMKEVLRDLKVLPSSGRLLLLLLVVLITLSLVAAQCTTSLPSETEPSPLETMPPTKGLTVATPSAPETQYVPADWPLVVEFNPFGRLVTTMVPWQGRVVEVEELEVDPELPCNPEYPGDRCNQIVLDFRVISDTIEGPVTVMTFSPAITLEVAYEREDVEAVGGLTENLTLRYWESDPEQQNEGTWIAFTRTEHGFRTEGDETGGFGYVNISTWSDRAVCWGEPD
jgi:hypothetical protein